MPIKKSAYKELRKARSRHFKNISTKSELKTITKSFDRLINDKKTDEAKKAIDDVVSKINRAASKGVIRPNTAARKISRLMKKLSSKKAK